MVSVMQAVFYRGVVAPIENATTAVDMSLNSNDAGFTERIAAVSAELAVLVSLVENHIHLQLADLADSGDVDAQERFAVADPERWLENARNSLQVGVMFLERAVRQPARF